MGTERKNINRFTPKQKLNIKQVTASKKTLEQQRITGWRLWLFRIIAITVVPALLFALTELCLRVFEFGYDSSAIIKRDINGKTVCCNNTKFGWRFFPKNISRETTAFVFPAAKPPETYRIFILGGSAAQGTPDSAYSFGRILKVLLDNQYPGLKTEVINLAMPAVNSHAVLLTAKACARYQPDLFIVYLGNNEVVGPYGAGTIFSPLFPSLTIIRASIAIKSTRIGQMLERLLGSFASQKGVVRTWDGMQMFLEKQVRFDSDALKHVYSHFERNLEDICKAGCKTGAKVIVCTVGTNLKDCPPFASLHRPDLTKTKKEQWESFYQKGVELESEDEYNKAIEYYSSAAEIDEHFADLHFRMGRMFWLTNDYASAKKSYTKARDLDTLRFRADTKINKIIRSVGANKTDKGIYFVDTVAAIEENSPHQTPGKELFWEHVHNNFKGNYIIARNIFEHINEVPLSQIKGKQQNKRSVLTEQQCMERLAYTPWDSYQITEKVLWAFIKKPPFTNQLYQDERVRELEHKIETLKKYTTPPEIEDSLSLYQSATKLSPSDWRLRIKYASFLDKGLGNQKAAIENLSKSVQHLPDCYAYDRLGTLLFKQNKVDEAIQSFYRSLEIKPTFANAHYDLALVLQLSKKDMPAAIKHYSKAIEIDPKSSSNTYNNFAFALRSVGRTNEAIEILSSAIKIYPVNLRLHYALASFLNEQGRTNEAICELLTVLGIQPNHSGAKQLLIELAKKEQGLKN